MSDELLDCLGRRRPPATTSTFHTGRPPGGGTIGFVTKQSSGIGARDGFCWGECESGDVALIASTQPTRWPSVSGFPRVPSAPRLRLLGSQAPAMSGRRHEARVR